LGIRNWIVYRTSERERRNSRGPTAPGMCPPQRRGRWPPTIATFVVRSSIIGPHPNPQQGERGLLALASPGDLPTGVEIELAGIQLTIGAGDVERVALGVPPKDDVMRSGGKAGDRAGRAVGIAVRRAEQLAIDVDRRFKRVADEVHADQIGQAPPPQSHLVSHDAAEPVAETSPRGIMAEEGLQRATSAARISFSTQLDRRPHFTSHVGNLSRNRRQICGSSRNSYYGAVMKRREIGGQNTIALTARVSFFPRRA
jgi:hypothetical protein